jgi:hypothetical protein
MKDGEFIIAPMVAAALFGADPNLLWFALGCVLWTFTEYSTHRLLHVLRLPLHHHHHARPREEPSPIFWPFWTLVFGLVWLAPLAMISGLAAAYTWFINVHRDCHHNTDNVLPSLLEHHDKHHHAHPNSNFGVSTRFWDWAFRTLA